MSYKVVNGGSRRDNGHLSANQDPPAEGPPDVESQRQQSSWFLRKVEVPWWCIIVSAGIIAVLLICGIGIPLYTRSQTLPEPRSPEQCPVDWAQITGRCYYLSDDRREWNASEKFCKLNGASLVVISNNTKNDLKKLNTRDEFWIGLRRTQKKWEWVDGAAYDGEVADYHSDSQLNCAYLNAKIGALDCSTPRRFICSKTIAMLVS